MFNRKQHYKENKERIKKKQKEYYQNNKDKVLIREKKKRNKLCPICKKILIYSKSPMCKSCSHKDSKCYAWKGDKAGYKAIHMWIRKNKPKPEFCEECNTNKPKEIANISGEYKRDINDYRWLCHKCHMKIDKVAEKSGAKQLIKLDIKKIKRLRKEKKTYEEIGKIMGVSRSTIWRRLKMKEFNLPDYLEEDSRERDRELRADEHKKIWIDENRFDLKQQYLEEKQEEYNTFNQDRDEEFIDQNKVEFDDFCTKEYEEDGE